MKLKRDDLYMLALTAAVTLAILFGPTAAATSDAPKSATAAPVERMPGR